MSTAIEEEFLKTSELAEKLKVSAQTVRKMVKTEGFPVCRPTPSSHPRYLLSEVKEWMRRQLSRTAS